MSKYLITLTPIGKFFFGGDMTFKVGDDKDHNEEFSSYIIESNKMPQQTSLLGMLRFLILSNDFAAFDKVTQKIKDHDAAQSLIGESSFTVNENGHKGKSFGKIISLSECFLRKGDTNLQPCRLDYGLDVTLDGEICMVNGMERTMAKVCYNGNYPNKDVIGKAFNSKMPVVHGYMYGKTFIPENDIFKEDRRIGISRDIHNGATDDDALFKQINYRFPKDEQYGFAFYTEIEDGLNLTQYDGQTVSLGGDNSRFVIGIKTDDSKAECYTEGTNVVLLSPSYIEDVNADFAIAETIPFRFLKTNIRLRNYDITASHLRSKQCSLYKEGSVFYFKDKDACNAFVQQIMKYEDFYQIGYNHFRIGQ